MNSRSSACEADVLATRPHPKITHGNQCAIARMLEARDPNPDCRRIPTTCAKTDSRKDVAPTGTRTRTRTRTSTLKGLNHTLGPSVHRKAFLWSVRVCTSQSFLGSHDVCPKHCPSWHRSWGLSRISDCFEFRQCSSTTNGPECSIMLSRRTSGSWFRRCAIMGAGHQV